MVEVRVGDQVRGGVGLAADRVAQGPAVLMTTASDHVALRTPTRPDHRSGNALHLFSPPDALEPWLRRLRTTIGVMPGVQRGMVAWAALGAPDREEARAGLPDDLPEDVEVDLVTTLEWCPDLPRDDTSSRRAALAAIDVPDPALLDIRRADADDRVLAGARALYLQAGWGQDVDYWRWHTAQHIDLAVAARCATWVLFVMGIPACRLTIAHDHAGLAVIEDVVTHPLHRRKGLASALVVHALTAHLDERPVDRMVIRADAQGPAQRLYERLGFAPVGLDVVLTVPLA